MRCLLSRDSATIVRASFHSLRWEISSGYIRKGVLPLNSIVMIVGVISASVILFMGLNLERFISPLRMVLATITFTLFIIIRIMQGDVVTEMLWTGEGLGSIWNLATRGNTLLESMGILAIVLAAATLGRLAQKRFPRTSDAFSDLVLAMVISTTIMGLSQFGFTITVHMIISAIIALLAVCCHIVFPERYIITTSSIVGGSAIALLFSKFYFLPVWVSFIIALVFGLSGYFSQTHAYQKKKRSERIFNGEEPA